ncbi:MAG: helix-turn-helix transcriptional regulator [Candidatus Woesearchaeota archaeon]|nr:MAG: helix-turn-helix transcriptional regulator [Candidatus Woesearchaeota archaeon]
MSKGKFLLLNLEEEQTKQLSEMLSNTTSRKIMNFLADKEHAAESEISKALSIPISTTHYNLQKLKQSGLVSVEEFHYSKKGKEIDHYKLANKYVIIAPKSVKGITSQLSKILPAFIGLGIISLLIEFKTKFLEKTSLAGTELGQTIISEKSAIAQSLPSAQIAEQARDLTSSEPNIALWFFIGGLVVIFLYLLVDYFRKK